MSLFIILILLMPFQYMSSPNRKRQKLSSPITSIETIPISDESGDEDQPKIIPFIKIEDISSDDSDTEMISKDTAIMKAGTSNFTSLVDPSSAINSPMKMLAQANIFDNRQQTNSIRSSEPSSTTSPCNVEVSKADSQSNVISTTTMLSPFSGENKVSTLGSPRYMVQEISSTVVLHKRFLLTGLNR